MDFSESTKVVYNRIQKLEPENVSKIIGYLLLQDHGEREMIRLAFSPDNFIQYLINKAKTELGLSSKPAVSSPISPPQVNPSPLGDFLPQGYSDSVPDDFRLQSQIHFLAMEDQLENSVGSEFSGSYYYAEQALNILESVCHYFNKGFCKHGNSCRYFHGHPMLESFSQIFSPGANDLSNDDHVFPPGSLEKLELELTELLKSRRGCPVSIASLPMMYYEKYGRTLQAEGYLTESQRHGKAGYSLTKLLARLKNSIRLIDRPHGQHSVILAEDLPKYMEVNGERSDPGAIVGSSKQIYLTFPADSTFTEQDVSNYFNKFGPVQDVRIPCQQKRMFGFQILTKGNPHYICGARVLVKPYREKASSRTVDRRQHPMYYSPHFIDGDSELQSIPRVCDNSRLLRKQQLMEEHEQALELERRRLSELQLTPKSTHPYFGYSMDEFKQHSDAAHAEQAEFPSAERLNYLLEVLNNGSTSEDRSTNYNEQESQGLNLPESPFASPIRNSISTVT
ncbi:hypothetical protein PVL29_015638 [Vitis rotundifolia]|uniref:Zinc finger CCCH domain-containing protein 18-like n=1 Tax=Vitis rotundifolia TaxID=103349 RepID=A0AA38ZD74_VITRO|nr:hypothetical protein PVL29_015638 [Vitis rotundifolia]